MSDIVVSMAEAEYERQYSGQDAAEVRRRGGLGSGEVVTLLAQALIRFAPPDKLIPASRR